MKALELFRQCGDVQGQVISLCNIGMNRMAEGSQLDAEGFFLKGLELSSTTGHLQGEMISLLFLGDSRRRAGDYTEVLKHNRAASDLAQEINDPFYLAEGHLSLGEIYLDMGNTEAAIETLRQAMDMASAIGSKELQVRALRGLEAGYKAKGQSETAEYYRVRCRQIEDEMESGVEG